ncbi:MAG: LemA family protein, partial [Bacillota bacterium]|nr:LemA family protein [Bacillota bacterium]
KARNTYLNVTAPQEQLTASKEMNMAIGRILLLSEQYPDLKADASFLNLQNELSDIEKAILTARENYNNAVNEYQTQKEMFPSNIVAYFFEFKNFSYYGINETDEKVFSIEFK